MFYQLYQSIWQGYLSIAELLFFLIFLKSGKLYINCDLIVHRFCVRTLHIFSNVIHSYKILHRKITHLQTELQKSTTKEEQGPVLPEAGAEELCWHRAHRETEGGDQQHCRTVTLTVTKLAEYWMIVWSQIRGVTKPEWSRTEMTSKQWDTAQLKKPFIGLYGGEVYLPHWKGTALFLIHQLLLFSLKYSIAPSGNSVSGF